MKLTVGQLRNLIKEVLSGSQPDETYEEELLSDPKFKEKSVFVRDDAKEKIKSWAKQMHLSTK